MKMFGRGEIPAIAHRSSMALAGAVFLITKMVAVWIIMDAYIRSGGDPKYGLGVAAIALFPSAIIEFVTIVLGHRFARAYLENPLGPKVQKGAWWLGACLYLVFFANVIGLFGTGFYLDIGMAVAAPILAPLAPTILASGAIRLLGMAVEKGAAFEQEADGTI